MSYSKLKRNYLRNTKKSFKTILSKHRKNLREMRVILCEERKIEEILIEIGEKF